MTENTNVMAEFEKVVGLDLNAIFDPNAYADNELRGVHDLFWGPTNSGKTYSIAMLALWLWKNHKQKTHWVTGDQGFQTVSNLGLVRSGAVTVIDFSQRPEPGSTLERLCEGWGLSKKMILGTDIPQLEKMSRDQFDEIGLWVFEGLGEMARYYMGNIDGGLNARAAKTGKLGGVESVTKFDDEIDVGGGKRSHGVVTGYTPYAQAQSLVMGCKRRTDNLPHVIWTTHEREAEDKMDNKRKVIGPEVAGGALTPIIAGMFGNTLHFTTVQRKVEKIDEFSKAKIQHTEMMRRYYPVRHPDPDGTVFMEYIAGNRCPIPGIIQPYYNLLVPSDSLKFYVDLASARRQMLAFTEFVA